MHLHCILKIKPNASTHLSPTRTVFVTVLLILSQTLVRINLIENKYYILSKIAQIWENRFFNLFLQFREVCNYTFLIKFVLDILTKSRRMIIDGQLNSFLENCLKTVKVAFIWAVVLGFKKPVSFQGIYYTSVFVCLFSLL